jgi:hypothetical protein
VSAVEQSRHLVTEIPGPASLQLTKRRAAAVSRGARRRQGGPHQRGSRPLRGQAGRVGGHIAHLTVGIVRKPSGIKTFHVLQQRWVV